MSPSSAIGNQHGDYFARRDLAPTGGPHLAYRAPPHGLKGAALFSAFPRQRARGRDPEVQVVDGQRHAQTVALGLNRDHLPPAVPLEPPMRAAEGRTPPDIILPAVHANPKAAWPGGRGQPPPPRRRTGRVVRTPETAISSRAAAIRSRATWRVAPQATTLASSGSK